LGFPHKRGKVKEQRKLLEMNPLKQKI